MAPTSRFPDDEQVLRAAADWWTRLRDPQAPAQTVEQWLAWMAADERHARAFEQVSELGAQLAALAPAIRRQAVAEFAPPRPARRRWPAYLAAAAAMLVLAVLGLRLAGRAANGGATGQAYASAVGQERDIALPDGSDVALGGASALVARYAPGSREVELRDGEAFFRVAHERRPFVVVAGPLRISDLGTAFNVRRTGPWVSVAVTEGRVRIVPPRPAAGSHAGAQAVDAVAGQRVAYNPETGTLGVVPVAGVQAMPWRSNRLEFVDEPLAVVVANINRYSRRPVQIADARLGALAFTGTVKIDAIDSWIGALPRIFPLQVSTFADRVVLSGTAPR